MLNAIAEAEGWSLGWPSIEAIATILLVIATFVVAVIALFPEWTHGRFYYPEGLLRCGNDSFFFQGSWPAGGAPPLYPIRLQLENSGNALATIIECHLLGITVVHGNTSTAWPGFVPMRLRETHSQKVAMDYLTPRASKLFDLGSLGGYPVPALHLSTEVAIPASVLPPNSYRIDVIVTSKERVLFRGCLELSFANSWTSPNPNSPFQSVADFRISETAYGGE
jgi:hypothetical protein